MRLLALLLAMLVLSPTPVLADVSQDLKSAAESADGVIIGLAQDFSTGAYSYLDLLVLEVLKGPDPGENLGVVIPPELISGTDIMEVRRAHGNLFIIPYRGPVDEKGWYTYAGPRFDSPEIIATPENADVVKPGAKVFHVPSFEQAIREADAVAIVGHIYYNPNEDIKKLRCRVTDILKGHLPEKNITVSLGGNYLYWIFGKYNVNCAPLGTRTFKILPLTKDNRSLRYAGPEFTSPYFSATSANLAEVRRLLEAKEEPVAKSEFDWTWWIVGAAAAVVALIAALLVSKVDYKYDRRKGREKRLESGKKLRRSSGADSNTGPDQPEK